MLATPCPIPQIVLTTFGRMQTFSIYGILSGEGCPFKHKKEQPFCNTSVELNFRIPKKQLL
jgi:hypothetical protein